MSDPLESSPDAPPIGAAAEPSSTGAAHDTQRATVDAARYVSPDFAARERERLFARVWLFAGFELDLGTVGASFTFDFGDQSLLVVKGPSAIRAFHNVCRHRGRALTAEGTGHAPRIVCPYHRWTWDLDGSLASIPCRADFPELPPDAELSLLEVPCETFEGLVFVHLGRPSTSLAEYLGRLGERLSAYGLARYELESALSVELACNWKVPVDASNENYHIPSVHPELLGVFDDGGRGEIEVVGDHALGTSEFTSPSSLLADRDTVSSPLAYFLRDAGLDPADFAGRAREARPAIQRALRARSAELGFDALADSQLTDYASYFFFPNTHFHIQGLHLNVSRVRPDARDPQRCVLDQWTFDRRRGDREPRPRPAHQRFVHGHGTLGATTDEDTAHYGEIQRGLATGRVKTLHVGNKERRLQHMHAVLDRYLARDP